jgi:hypothetical protein
VDRAPSGCAILRRVKRATSHTKPLLRQRRIAALLVALSTTLGAAGCGRGVSGYCEDAATCEFGNDADVDACIISFEVTEDLADVRNCNDEFAEWFDCIDEESRCDDERYRPGGDRCDTERDRLRRCIDD